MTRRRISADGLELMSSFDVGEPLAYVQSVQDVQTRRVPPDRLMTISHRDFFPKASQAGINCLQRV